MLSTSIKGKLYLAGRSDFSLANLYLHAEGYQLDIEGCPPATGLLSQLSISDRLGNIARKITLPDGSVFETTDNDAVDLTLSKNHQPRGFMGFVHLLERNMTLAIVSILIVVAVVFSGVKWGVPAASHIVAQALPSSANQVLSNNILAFLDKYIFEPSKLDAEEQQTYQNHFIEYVSPLYQAKDAPEFTLHFRLWTVDGDKSIPNAIALPAGDIIVTDRFVELAQTQDEIDIVLLHEMGHIVERHSLEQVIEGGSIAVAITLVFGDVSWLADMGVGVGSFLISSFYSRSHEAEADKFAYQHSLQAGINPESLGQILIRMEQDMDSSSSNETENASPTHLNESEHQDDSLIGYFSTHPSSPDRIEMGKHFQVCFDKGLTNCP